MTTNDAASTGSASSSRPLSKYLVVAGFAMVLAIVAIAFRTPPATGYEPSIYDAYPWFFWVLVVLALLIGQVVVLRDALRRYPESANWRLGFLLVLVVQTLLFLVPYLRGYPVYGAADVLTHLGFVQTIDTTGGGMLVNVYQNLHHLVLALSYATGIEPMHVINAVAGVLSLFVLVAAYVFLSTVFDRRRTLMTLPFVMVLVAGRAHLNPSPFAQSVLLLPFVLYLFARTQQTESLAYRLCLAVAVVGLVTYHPLTALFLLFVFLAHYLAVRLTRTSDPDPVGGVSTVSSKLVMQLSLVSFVAWYYNFVGIFLRFELVVRRLLGQQRGETDIARYGTTVAEYSPDPVDLVTVGLAREGQTAVYLAVGVAVLATTLAIYRGRGRFETPYLLTFALGFGLFSALGAAFLTNDLIGGYGRPLVFAEFFAALAAGSVLYYALDRLERRAAVTSVAVVVLAALVVFSVVGLYPSPMTREANLQVTNQNLDGANWYVEHSDEDTPFRQMGIGIHRFEDALDGTNSRTLPRDQGQPPDHFNYTEHDTLGASYDETQYLIVTERGRAFYPTVYPDYEAFWRFTAADWERLAADPSVTHVYDNGEFDVYVVAPTNDSTVEQTLPSPERRSSTLEFESDTRSTASHRPTERVAARVVPCGQV